VSLIIKSSQAHPTHVSALSSQTTTGSYPGGYPTPPHGGCGHPVSVFPVPFGVPALACCVIPSPLRTSALLTVGPPSQLGLDLNGITAFRRYETRSGWASALSRGGGVLPTGRASPVGACRFPAASPSPSLPPPVGEGSSDKTSTEIHTINPSDLSLAHSPRTEREPFGVSLQLRTPPLPATHAKAGTGLTDTDPELHPRHQSNLPTASPLTTCDLASHRPLYPGNGGVHTTVAWSSAAACRLSTARSLKPWCSYPPQGLTMTRHHQGFTIIHPAQPSPHL
jgi:hypothetical protein